MSRYNINVRLATLGRRKVEIIKELANRGINVTPAQFSNFTNGVQTQPKSEIVLEAADKIISEWEAVANGS